MSAALATINTWNKMNSSDRSPGGLLKLSVGALVAALLAMVLFVLPAEYDMDPTGLGEIMGIKGMSGYQVGALTTQSDWRSYRISRASGWRRLNLLNTNTPCPKGRVWCSNGVPFQICLRT